MKSSFPSTDGASQVTINESREATKSALERASDSGTRFGRRLRPFFEKQKRSFLNFF